MNSAEELSKYKENIDSYYSPTLSRRLLGYGYDFPEKSPKKEKKWSLGSLFRRKKKDESDSSSDDDLQKKGFLGRKKRKPDKKKKPNKPIGTFDHVVLSRNSHLYSNGFNGYDEAGIFSDPGNGFGYGSKSLPKTQSQEIVKQPVKNATVEEVSNSRSTSISGSTEVGRKSRKGLAKVRAEARRVNLKRDSSSDEDSQRSVSSTRFRSDESLGQGYRDGSLSRRSRAARTERYLKRHSRDGENPKDFLRLSKSDAENSVPQWKTSDDSNRSLSRSPLLPPSLNKTKTIYSTLSQSPNISGLSTIPPSHSNSRIKVSNSTSNPSYKPPLSMNDYNYSTRKLSNDYLSNQRSLSCDANIHKSLPVEAESEIIHVQFPIGKPNNRLRNLSLIESRHVNACHARQPPPPPPRDPRRLVTAQYYDNVRPITCYLDSPMKSKSFHTNSQTPAVQTKKFTSFNKNCRSTSEDHIPQNNVHLIPRPSSATPDASQRRTQVNTNLENYNYLTDKKPRSRKPIFIQSNNSLDSVSTDKSETQKALDFWKQKDKDSRSVKNNVKTKRAKSPQMFTCQTHVQTQVFLPSVLQNDITSENITKSMDTEKDDSGTNRYMPVLCQEPLAKEEENEDLKRKSSNLEEALDELEAIYNSLRLGDEDLLERAEKREKDAAEQKLKEEGREVYSNWSTSRGALSDSSFSYEPFDSIGSPRRKRFVRKSQTIDRRADDMAFRKLNKERSATINDPQGVLSKISYLNASPVYGKEPKEHEVPNKNSKEPDITLDDVVYRNVKFANNCPKVVEPQPPFGIPLGPITPAANSDYLHAVPDNIPRPMFKPRKIPDLVKDDLAFRNLRKDQGKEPALPPLSPDDLKNNNASEPKLDLDSLKKKRAVRSLSANIGSIINKNFLSKGLEKHGGESNESKTLTDIADAMEIARQVLMEKENKISATRRAFLSDTDTNNGNDSITESRMNFLNSLKTPSDHYLQAKPPRGVTTPECKSPRSPKESTPIPVEESRDSSLDDLLTALATEARETNERIAKELKSFEDRKRKKSPADENLNNYELTKTLSDIDAVSEQAKLCEKLLEGVVDSTDLMASAKPVLEEVGQIDTEATREESVANVVLTRDDSKNKEKSPVKLSCESDHDYENLVSDQELNLDEAPVEDVKCTSPFEEHKAELIATFQELKNNVSLDLDGRKENDTNDKENDETVAGKHPPRRSRSRLPRWLRPHSSGNLSDPTIMSEGQDSRAERIARYKEQRRKELAAQFNKIHIDSPTSQRRNSKDSNSSSSEGPRTTRTSRLRAAISSQENCSSPQKTKLGREKTPPVTPTSNETGVSGSRRIERDKSSKRKSNLNRSLNSEEVPNLEGDDVKNRRRRRRFFPQEVLDQTADSSNDDKVKSDTSHTASFLSQSSTSPNTASPRLTPRKSELSIHMENARKGIAPSYSEMGRTKPAVKRPMVSSSPKDKFDNSMSDKEISRRASQTKLNGENKTTSSRSLSDNDSSKNYKSISKKMEELTALTKETLAQVERLASKNEEQPKQIKRPLSSSPKRIDKVSRNLATDRLHQPFSILKKKIAEEPVIVESVPNTAPVSILKRKVSQDDHKTEGASSTHTPPVTFSPSVIEPATTNRKQGILKKRRSLDESQVMRHRSCSPDVANKAPDSRSILKNQRRSSMEELTRTQSPEQHLHGILKRKTSKTEDDDHSLNSPQGILKRRSGASSAGSTSSTPHVSITTAVILAAAGGAEMVLEGESVKPILKKKSFSEESSYNDNSYCETPKPILKKKSSTDTDECEERPKKPILKISRNSLERDSECIKHGVPSESECDVKPILKQNGKEEGARPRLSFCGDTNDDSVIQFRSSRRSHTICADFNVKSDIKHKEEDRQLKKPRPLSVSELVMNFENSTSTGAIPKRTSLKRTSDRYRTQPVTSNELEASLNLVRSPQVEDTSKLPKSSPLLSPVANQSRSSFLDFTSSLESDSNLNSFLSSLHNTSPDSGVCGKMSSDSAFQSLGDGLELDQDEDKPLEVASKPGKLETNLELQMKAIAEEAQRKKLAKGGAGVRSYRNRKSYPSDAPSSSRFSTQPITYDEVREAARVKENSDGSEDKEEADPSNLSLHERIKFFSVKLKENNSQKRDVPKRRPNRFQTQPVTSDEVENARCISPTAFALEDGRSGDHTTSERRGILKSSGSFRRGDSHPRSALKKRDSFDGTSDYENRCSILKSDVADVTYDEGISCNDSASDSEAASVPCGVKTPEIKVEHSTAKRQTKVLKSSSETSDGESSGGREIRSIFKNENKLKVKQKLESVLSKSKSQNTFRDENESSNKKGSAIRRSQTQSTMPRAIEEIQAKLQQSGESGWKKRVQQNNNSSNDLKLLNMNRYNDELSQRSILEIKKDELDAASKQWKNRVEKSDADNFSVAGKMEKNREESNLQINIAVDCDKSKKTPQAKRFKGKEGSEAFSTPVSPDKNRHVELSRSFSVPDPDQDNFGSESFLRTPGQKVIVSRPDDETYKSFYKSIEGKEITEQIEVSQEDFDLITRQSLLVQKKNVQVRRRRGASKNPIKALASRTDITNEYTEIITGVAEREKKRQNIQKLAKSSSFATAALAGLASKEDFKSVALKKSRTPLTSVPYKDLMLLHVKGRQFVQTRLVEPVASSINEGDNYILVTPSTLYNYTGKYSNVIEQSRAADIINHIQRSGDLGCQEAEVVNINSENCALPSKKIQEFWQKLKSEAGQTVSGGHHEEDGIYESNILATNMIYKLESNELVPFDEFWGKMPKIEILKPTEVLVFDFGTEMYVWSGKNAPPDKKKVAFKLAKEMWDLGYDYSECSVCPLNVASVLGNRPPVDVSRKGTSRPDWALFAKLTQHRETILFKEKFLDWPDFSRVIKVKSDQTDKTVDASYNIKPCDVGQMLNRESETPDLVIKNTHLGRGDQWFDEETKRLYDFETLKISAWRVSENHPEQLSDETIGHFSNSHSYIIKWDYQTTVKGRDLSGKPSRYQKAGRDRCVYFCWQGSNASINEKGAAALLTVELDDEEAPQVRVVQGAEPAVFLKLFNGSMVVHDGKEENRHKAKLFMVRGELEDEVCLMEVPCEMKELRSRTSFILVLCELAKVVVWNGAKASKQKRKVAKIAAENIVEKKADEFCWSNNNDCQVVVVEEGEENEEFLEGVEGGRGDYNALVGSDLDYDYTMRLFHLSALSGTFQAAEILCPHRSEFSSPYPFLQTELYSASQPALFMIDNKHELWLWQGWWPEKERDEMELSDQTGSGAVRWQAERKAAMQTAVSYWRESHNDDEPVPAYLVWAGLEPLEFKNLFPCWADREDVAELNLKEGKRANARLSVEDELALLLRTTYPLAELLQRPLPEGVDPTHLEVYLSAEDFQELLSMTKEEFQKLPVWKQTAMKKEKGLF
ncbi:supervillin isoform X3 [Tribolium castaneum]